MTYLLLAEKPSAAKAFADALGGMSGTYNGKPYKITALFGHMTGLVNPHEMVSEDDVQRFKSWTPETMPWDTSKLSWKKAAQVSYNPKTKKKASKQTQLNQIKKEAKGCDAIVIATDKDPSGEGQLIGWEVIQNIGWTGPVKRMYFLDESKKELQQGFQNIQDLPSLKEIHKDGEYMKAETRNRWDFLSMQLVRLATHAVQNKGYQVKVVRHGRLKSVMVKLVADQLELVKQYVKKPYYEVKFKDENGNIFARKFEEGVSDFRFNQKADAEKDMQKYAASNVIEDSKTRKETAPGKLLDLGGLASILGTKGYKSDEVLKTYQKLYEARIVSYPRTEDKFISHEQFNQMLPLIDKIADVVGADKALLTHRTARKTHVKDGGAHGANRPGVMVPSSLSSIASYGPSAKAIYEILAKNFLAMFGENYEYDSYKAHIEKFPDFKATVNVPVKQGFKAIFDTENESKDSDDDDEKVSKGLGKVGNPTVAEGVNKKPTHPSHKWLEKQLGKYNVGTGATRTSTLSEVTTGDTALLKDSRGKLTLTDTGSIAAVLLEGAHIGNPKVTETLFQNMKAVGDGKADSRKVVESATSVIMHDKEVFYKNAEKLHAKIGKPSELGLQAGGKNATVKQQKQKAVGVFKPTGERVTFNKEFGGTVFTDEQVAALLAGKEIRITGKNPTSGKPFTYDGTLAQQEFKGRKYWGFKRKDAEAYDAKTAPMPASWQGYTFTEDDKKRLRNGEKIKIQAISKAKKPYDVDVTFEMVEFKGVKRWGINPHFEKRKKAEEYTRADAPFKPEFSGYKLSDKEIQQVRNGEKILVTPKSKRTGKEFTCTLSLELKTYEGNKFWGLDAKFN